MLYQIAVEKVGECVRDWKEGLPIDVQDERYEMIAGKRFIKNVGDGEIAIGVAQAMGKGGSKPAHFVSLGVTMSKKEAVSS